MNKKLFLFLATSDGSLESLNNTEGGYCKTKHMKLHVYVCNETGTKRRNNSLLEIVL